MTDHHDIIRACCAIRSGARSYGDVAHRLGCTIQRAGAVMRECVRLGYVAAYDANGEPDWKRPLSAAALACLPDEPRVTCDTGGVTLGGEYVPPPASVRAWLKQITAGAKT